VAGLPEPPLPVPALLALDVFCFEGLLVDATRSPFPGIFNRYPAI
jgi:hypothetical protein